LITYTLIVSHYALLSRVFVKFFEKVFTLVLDENGLTSSQ